MEAMETMEAKLRENLKVSCKDRQTCLLTEVGVRDATDLRSTPLSYIYNALFRDTPLGHGFCAQPNSPIAKYPNIWLIWLFGYLAACDKHGQVGYP